MRIREHSELDVYKKAFDAAMLIFELSKNFPKEETYSLTDQLRRSSRSVCSNLAEAWRKRRYKLLSLRCYPMRKRKPPKRRSGFGLLLRVAIPGLAIEVLWRQV
jgi:hypothetical protein